MAYNFLIKPKHFFVLVSQKTVLKFDAQMCVGLLRSACVASICLLLIPAKRAQELISAEVQFKLLHNNYLELNRKWTNKSLEVK